MAYKNLTGFKNAVKPQTPPDNVIKLQFTKLGQSNKSYLIQFWESEGIMRLAWGQTENPEGTESIVYATKQDVLEKEREKIKKGYMKVSGTEADAKAIKSKLPAQIPATVTNQPTHHTLAIDPSVIDLIKLVFQSASAKVSSYLDKNIADISLNNIQNARSILLRANLKIGLYQSNPTDILLQQLAEEYFSLIPTMLPRVKNRPDVKQAIATLFDFQEQEDRLKQLEAALAAYTYQQQQVDYQYDPVVQQYMSLGIELKPFNNTHENYGFFEKFFNETANREARIMKAYLVRIPNERQAFNNAYIEFPNVNKHTDTNVRHMFHGTQRHNVQHILRTGLIVPRTAANGRRMGDGIYFGPTSLRSLYYTDYQRNRRDSLPYLMFINQVMFGKSYKCNSYSGATPPNGYQSVFAPTSDGGRGGEHVVFKTDYQTARILLMVEPR